MTKQIKIVLTEHELRLLNHVATQQCRRPQDHARFLIVSGLDISPSDKQDKSATGKVYEAETVCAFAQ